MFIRLLLYLLCSLALPCLINAQSATVLTADAAEGYLAKLRLRGDAQQLTAGEDTLVAIQRLAQANDDIEQLLEANGWKAYYDHYLGKTDAALALCEQSMELAARNDVPNDAPALSRVNFILGINGQDPVKNRDFLYAALHGAPPGSSAEFEVKATLAHALVSFCSPKADSLIERLLPYLNSLPVSDRERLLNEHYYSKKAYYYQQCTGELEQAEVMRHKIAAYYKNNPEVPYARLWWVDNLVRIASLNAMMERRPAVDEILKTLDTINIQEVAPHAIPYFNMAQRLSNVYEFTDDFSMAEQVRLDFLKYADAHPSETNDKVYMVTYQGLRELYFSFGKYEQAAKIHEAALAHAGGFSTYNGFYSAKLPAAMGQHQVAIDSALALLRQFCEDCTPGTLPGIDNKLVGGHMSDQLVAEAYKLLAESTFLRSANPTTANLLTAIDYLNQAEPFYIRDYLNFATFEEGVFWSGQDLRNANNLRSFLYASLISQTAAGEFDALTFRAIEDSKANTLKPILPKAGLSAQTLEKVRQLQAQVDLLEVAKAEASTARKRQEQEAFLEGSATYRNFIYALLDDQQQQIVEAFSARSASLAELQAALAPDDVFLNYNLAYVDDQSRLITQVITRKTVGTYALTVPNDLQWTVLDYTRLLQSPLQAQMRYRERLNTISGQLYALLIAPVASQLSPGSRLVICPSESLAFLPFETLHGGADPRADFGEQPYLLRDYPISYCHSATTFIRSASANSGNNQRIAAFAPVFDQGVTLDARFSTFRTLQDSLPLGMRAAGLDPLPGTISELSNIQKAYPNAPISVFLRGKASKTAVLQSMTQPLKILHLATHGFVNEANNGLSALAFYGNAHAGDLLYLNEIKHQQLNIDLVVLSSCESGLGREANGEGLLSLNRAFFQAGGSNVVSSLWKIDDQVSSTFMQHFYQRTQANASYAEALRFAKLQLLEKPRTSLPRFWAPFVLVGR